MNNEDLLITIVMPLKYYDEEFLAASLQSVKEQTSSRWRLCVVVDAEDQAKVASVLQGFLIDDRIRLAVNKGTKFESAINTGIQEAKTRFVALLFGDDMWSTDAVAVLTRYITDFPEADFFHSSRRIVDEKGLPVSSVHYSKEQFDLADFKYGSPVKHLLCWSREKALEVGGIDESINSVGPDDYDFPWTMAENGATFKAVKECLYVYRDHCRYYRLTTHVPRRVHESEVNRILRKHGVGFWERRFLLSKARRSSFGIQTIYRSPLEKWLKDKLGYDARTNWKRRIYR